MSRLLIALLLPLLAGCVSTSSEAPPGPPTVAGPVAPSWAWSEPLRLTPEGMHGFEPSIEASSHGIYVTAARVLEDSQGASWLWHSPDGATFTPLPSPAGAQGAMVAMEGEIAVDDERLYFVDTYLADNTLSIWTAEDAGPAWEATRPLQGTHAVDDRPWLAAADGVLYYTQNAPVATPDPSGTALLANAFLYRSTDLGLNWAPMRSLPGQFCPVAANGATVVTGCATASGDVYAVRSDDQGATWGPAEPIAQLQQSPGARFPAIDIDASGQAFFAWIDGSTERGQPTTIHVARSTPADPDWTVLDVPYDGSAAYIAVSAHDGALALAFYGTRDNAAWYGEVVHTLDALADEPTWQEDRFDPTPVRHGRMANPDFFQIDHGPDGALHVAFGRHVGNATLGQAAGNFDDIRADVMYVQGRLG